MAHTHRYQAQTRWVGNRGTGTSDYKSYADGSSMLRKWNINSSLETTISYAVGNIEWKFGPQVRYQHLPGYSDPYPIKEYLVDYGFKLGFTKTLK